MEQQRSAAWLASLTLEEKTSLLSGMDFWRTQEIPAKGVPSVRMADGPHGVRKEDFRHARKHGGHSVPATCFPTAAAQACAWDPALEEALGKAIAAECLAQGVSVLLGPGVNIKRSPLCGRNFEYYSEDPLLAGTLGAAFIRGVQSMGVAACLKHFALNNQESWRFRVSAEVDERALREVYLKPFEIAVKQGKPETVMCSYNRVNGVYASEHRQLLTDILRKEWDFDGLVMSDWGAVNDRPKGVAAGLDLEMPFSGGETDRQVAAAVRAGQLKEEAVDAAALRVLQLVERHARQPAGEAQEQEHHTLAVRAAAECAVLLKNEGLLPLREKENVAVIGALAEKPRYQGAGSSFVNARAVSMLDAMEQNGWAYRNYAPGYRTESQQPDAKLEEQALAYAKTARVVLYFMGLTDIFEAEAYDRAALGLPENQTRLLKKLLRVNQNVVVVLAGGAPVVTPWAKDVPAVLYTALGGEGVGEAVYDLVFGQLSPSGKLAETWPLELADTPCALHYPMGPRAATYNESIYVGYRYYDRAEKAVCFPFGHGLSYASFAYSGLALPPRLEKGGTLRVLFSVKNTGACAADEISQVYAACQKSAVHRPQKVLVGYARTHLEPGEEKLITVTVPYAALEVWDATAHRAAVEAGLYEFCVGASSRDLRLAGSLEVAGETLAPAPQHSAAGPYGTLPEGFPDAAFYAVHTRAPLSNAPLRPGSYTMQTTLGEMRASPTARAVEKLALAAALTHTHTSANPAVKQRSCRQMVDGLPFKNIAMNLSGLMQYSTLQKLLDACNGRGSLAAAAAALAKDLATKKDR